MPDLCTLDDVKDWLSIKNSTACDSILARGISATSADFLRECKRLDLTPARDYTERYVGDGTDRLVLRHWPINDITTLTVDGSAVTESADLIADGYYFDADADPETRSSLILIGSVFTQDRPVIITYNAGYGLAAVTDELATVPAAPGPYAFKVADSVNFAYTTKVKYHGGADLVKVVGAPAAGQYAVATDGTITVHSSDAEASLDVSYARLGAPADVRQAVIEWVAYKYRGREFIGQTSKNLNQGETVSFQQVDAPDSVKAVIERYKRHVPSI